MKEKVLFVQFMTIKRLIITSVHQGGSQEENSQVLNPAASPRTLNEDDNIGPPEAEPVSCRLPSRDEGDGWPWRELG